MIQKTSRELIKETGQLLNFKTIETKAETWDYGPVMHCSIHGWIPYNSTHTCKMCGGNCHIPPTQSKEERRARFIKLDMMRLERLAKEKAKADAREKAIRERLEKERLEREKKQEPQIRYVYNYNNTVNVQPEKSSWWKYIAGAAAACLLL